MISSVASGQIHPSEIILAGQSDTRKVSLPVHTTQSVCSQFKYVRGIPVSLNDPAVPLIKLKLLNSLIHSINTIHSVKGAPEVDVNNSVERSSQGTDAEIRKVAADLQNEIALLDSNFQSITKLVDTTGSMFSTSA